jgi:Domain of unknown function (DUF4158)
VGTFLPDPLEVPWPVVDHLAGQLGIGDASVVKGYTERDKTAYEHAWEIAAEYGWRDFFRDELVRGEFGVFLEHRAWTHTEGRYALFVQAVAWLRRRQVLLFSGRELMRRVVFALEVAKERTNALVADAGGRSCSLISM